jgi:hypothetical protein
MRITLYTICYNEQEMLPYFLNHYSKIVDKIVVYENNSTDDSRKILDSFTGCEIEIIDFDTNNQYSEEKQTDIRNNCWKNDTTSDYIIVVDIDEIIYHPKFREFLRNKRNIDCFKPVGFDMIGDEIPTDSNKQIYEIIKTGTLNTMYSKVALFKRKNVTDSNFTFGSHFSSFKGIKDLVTYQSKGNLKLLHYKCLSYDYVTIKHSNYSKRRSDFSKKNGLGYHYDFGKDKILEEFIKLKDSSTEII